MIITIDTLKKSFSVQESPRIEDVLVYLQKHYPNEWKDFKIVERTVTIDNSVTNNFYGDEINTTPGLN